MISTRTAARSADGWWKMEKIFTNEKCVVFFIISSATYMCMIGISMCAFSLIFWYMKWNETTFQYWLCIYFPSTCLTCVLAKMARNITRLAYLSSIYFACVALSKADLLCFLSLLVFVCVPFYLCIKCLIFHPHFANKFIWNVVMSLILSSSCKYANNYNGERGGFRLFSCLSAANTKFDEMEWVCAYFALWNMFDQKIKQICVKPTLAWNNYFHLCRILFRSVACHPSFYGAKMY